MISTYILNTDGTIPDYVTNGGYFPDARAGGSPQDWTLVGVVTGDCPTTPFANAAALETYLTDIGGGSWTDIDGVAVDLAAMAAWMFAQS